MNGPSDRGGETARPRAQRLFRDRGPAQGVRTPRGVAPGGTFSGTVLLTGVYLRKVTDCTGA